MSNSFQQSFMHLVAANNALNGMPRLQPAPTAPPTGLTACWGTVFCPYLSSSDVERFRPCLDRVHQDNKLTRGVSSHLQRTRILPTPYRVEATPSTGEAAEPHRRHPHPNTTREFLPCEC